MRRLTPIIISVVVALMLAPVGANAGRDRGRVETAEYVAPNPSATIPGVGYINFANCFINQGCVEFEPRRGERSVVVKLDDVTGMSPYGYVYQDRNGDRYSDTGDRGPFCGETRVPVPISDKHPVYVFIGASVNTINYCGTLGTRGIVTARFFRSGPPLPPPLQRPPD